MLGDTECVWGYDDVVAAYFVMIRKWTEVLQCRVMRRCCVDKSCIGDV